MAPPVRRLGQVGEVRCVMPRLRGPSWLCAEVMTAASVSGDARRTLFFLLVIVIVIVVVVVVVVVVIVDIHILWFSIDQPMHGSSIPWVISIVLGLILVEKSHSASSHAPIASGRAEAAGTVPATGTAPWSLVVASQGVTPCEPSTAFGTDMWSLASMKLGVTFEIVLAAEARITLLTHKRLFVTVSQQMAF